MCADKVKVAVRVRPFNRREIDLNTRAVVDMSNDGIQDQTVLYHPSTGITGKENSEHHGRKAPKTFAFDHCFWSMDKAETRFASQEQVYNCLGKDVLQRAFEGYNACIFAYGQTGSGKSYTMMGSRSDKGIIPRLCDNLFERISDNTDTGLSFKIEVSYMEIYCERVHDLLDPKGVRQNLKVREHNILGPYVDGLSQLLVSSFNDVDNLMSEGNKSRTVAATNMNNESSRSHAVFNIILTQTLVDAASGVSGEKVSKLSLVDLAGSERAQKTGAMGDRLKEGSNINKSLTTLGLVISALADSASGKNKNKFVPYRDSVLTWLLKDNLGGNSKTVMVATVSPASDNYEESLSTLRYADRAKRIENHAVVNEDPNARIIRELREEVDELRKQLDEAQVKKANQSSDGSQKNKIVESPSSAAQVEGDGENLQEKLQESEKLIADLSKTWEQKLKETEQIHQERHATLEKMGVSVQKSGIKVEHGKYFLVNLNADPSLNELLVYYLKDTKTLVGRADAKNSQDIQLSGLGILPEHCILEIENQDVYLTSMEKARTCVNGAVVKERTKLKHGDRVLWGNNHFFRINCPKANSPSSNEPGKEAGKEADYDFAQQELMMHELSVDPITEAISAIEKQHEDEKLDALEKQRKMYEQQMQSLRSQLMTPTTPSQPFPPIAGLVPSGMSNQAIHPKYQQWAAEREKMFTQSLAKLRQEVIRAKALVREANFLALEMNKKTEFFVTLQIPAANLSPNRKRGAFVSEPAILVKRKNKGSQVWSMEKFEIKIIYMREMYEERKDKGLPMMVDYDNHIYRLDDDSKPPTKGDPFYESQENHNLIGVANVFLECLFYDVKLDYHVPIINQQGEVAGKLHVEISRETLPEKYSDGTYSYDEQTEEQDTRLTVGTPLICRVCIKEARGLPPALSHFVFCQYQLWGHTEAVVVPPIIGPDVGPKKKNSGMSFMFNHMKEFEVRVTEEFIEHASEGALSFEVWGHKSAGLLNPTMELESVQAKSRSLLDRWNELTRKVEMWVEVQELNDQGEHIPVDVQQKPEVLTGGIYQIRQGQSRRILAKVKPVADSGTLPIICESITSISVGCICARSKLQKGLDSYQEEDLTALREKWSDMLMRRKDYLDEQIQRIMHKEDKTDSDAEREKSLIDQWVCLTEERNAVLVPQPGSGIPGAPADWDPPSGMEEHVPVIYLDLTADDMSTPSVKEGGQAAGIMSILPKEHGTKFYNLPIIKYNEREVCALASWDSSIHDSIHLNRVTPSNERVYLIIKVVVRLSHPASMELVLRKRVCINVYKRQSLTEKFKKRISKFEMVQATGVMYEVVSNIPKASEDLEDRESLAQMAASNDDEEDTTDGETYIEKYIKGVSAVESILTLDRLRQEVAIKENMAATGQSRKKTEVAIKEFLASSGKPIRRATSVPNFQQWDLFQLYMAMRLDSPSNRTDDLMHPSDSVSNLSMSDMDGYASLPRHLADPFNAFRRMSDSKEPNFNKNSNFGLGSPKAIVSPQPAKLVKPMRTLMEESQHKLPTEAKPLLLHDESDDDYIKSLPTSPMKDSIDSDDFQEFESYQSQNEQQKMSGPQKIHNDGITPSGTSESLNDAQVKSFTPSMTSSGYGSQAVSTLTLSSEDSLSARSYSLEQEDAPVEEKKRSLDGDSSDLNSPSKAIPAGSEFTIAGKAAQIVKPQQIEAYNVAALNNKNMTGKDMNDVYSNELDNLLDADAKIQSVKPLSPLERQKSNPKDLEIKNFLEGLVAKDKKSFSSPVTSPRSDNSQLKSIDHMSTSDTSNDGGDGFEADEASNNKNTSEVSHNLETSEVCEDQGEEEPLQSNLKKEGMDDTNAYDTIEDKGANIDTEHIHEVVKTEDINEPLDSIVNHVDNEKSSFSVIENVQSEENVRNEEENIHSKSVQNKVENDVPEVNIETDNSNVIINPNFTDDDLEVHSTNVRIIEQTLDDIIENDKTVNTSVGLTNNNAPEHKDISDDSTPNKNTSNTLPQVQMRHSPSLDLNKPVFRVKKGEHKAGGPMKAFPMRPMSTPDAMLDIINDNQALGSQKSEESLVSDRSEDHSDNDDSMSMCSFGSRADLNRLHESPVPSWIVVGEPVTVLSSTGPSKSGTVRYVGETDFASGPWVGVELDQPEGKNDGSVKGRRYFKARSRHGTFVRHDKLIMDKKRRASPAKTGSMPPSLRRSLGNLANIEGAKTKAEKRASFSPGSSFMKPTSSSVRRTSSMKKN